MEHRQPACQKSFFLSSFTTMAPDRPLEQCSPAGMYRLLCASSGHCEVVLSEQTVHLIGTRMLLFKGCVSYKIASPTEDVLLAQLDFGVDEGGFFGCSLGDLSVSYGDYRRLCAQPDGALVFHDSFALVLTTLRSLQAYAHFEAQERRVYTASALAYLMLVIATALGEDGNKIRRYNKHVRSAVQYIHDNYMLSITTDDIASHVGIHAGHLHRLFLAETECSIGKYLTRLRMGKAKTLLMRTDIPMADIACLVGISTQQYFCRVFKQQVGMTPQSFRKSYNVTCDYKIAQQHYETVSAPMH